ncbi:unnamed protein product [Rotaria sp. Silwood1]|nr:unnamed protein product [Rotaria sp. Silwood1]CAF3713514.1 unnamed protein product [Rotaria sp. Silwood1]CAF4694585.1 unnamed protein product [Rotaria sp. Silwood1]CAF4735041.1 unnamed protein product [Rotaria sp. Silwood1]
MPRVGETATPYIPRYKPAFHQVTQIEYISLLPCSTGYTRTPSGSCVNLLIDFNNCGSVGYVCASSFTSCSNGVCSNAPAVLLPGAVAVSNWGGSLSVDDVVYTLSVPFNISMYGFSTTTPTVTTNGVVCLSSCSNAYTNGNLPTSSFSGPTALGYWDDLMIYASTSQSVYYGTTGTAPNRSLVFEFYESHYGQSTQYYHFQIVFYENIPDVVDFLYFQISDGGSSATIGVQSSGSGSSITYAVNQANSVPVGTSATNSPTLILSFDTNTSTMTQTTG